MERDDLAIDGLLRELARAPEGEDHAFVSRVLARTQTPAFPRAALLAAAVIFLAMGVFLAFAPEAPTGRIVAARPSCVGPDAARMRLLMKDAGTGRLLLLGEVPMDAAARVPAGSEILLQAVGADGLALWTSPRTTKVAGERRSGAAIALDRKDARSVEYTRDVKPILDQHCAGCHVEAELVRSAVQPYEARRSPLVTQAHAPLSGAERQQLALWVDLGATGRP
jgi:hypothetical protein